MADKPITEKVILGKLWKQDGDIRFDVSKSANAFEVLGFLKCYVKGLENELLDTFEKEEGFSLY